MFVGIPLEGAVVRELGALTERLKGPDDGLRWATAAGWHITLQFLGKTSAEQCDCVTKELGAIRRSRLGIELEAPGFFERAGVFFAGVRVSPELASLQQAVTAATARCGFAAEERPYHPHITLARSREGRSGAEVSCGQSSREGAVFEIRRGAICALREHCGEGRIAV